MNEMIAAFLARVFVIPTKLATQLEGLRELEQIRDLLTPEMIEALYKLSEYDPQAFRVKTMWSSTMMKMETNTLKLFRGIAKLVAPPPQLKVSDWANLHRQLSSESSAESGQWRTDRAPSIRQG